MLLNRDKEKQEVAMNHEEAFKTTYEKALEYRRIYLSKALEAKRIQTCSKMK